MNTNIKTVSFAGIRKSTRKMGEFVKPRTEFKTTVKFTDAKGNIRSERFGYETRDAAVRAMKVRLGGLKGNGFDLSAIKGEFRQQPAE